MVAAHADTHVGNVATIDLEYLELNHDAIIEWLNASSAELKTRLMNGEISKHFKVVQGRRGAATYVEGAAEYLYPAIGEVMYDKKLKTPTQLMKLLKSSAPDLVEVVEERVVRKEGAPTLALLNDKRPAYNPSILMFDNLENGE